MTRKDYVKIAEVLQNAKAFARSNTHAVDTIDKVANELSTVFMEDNSRFDRSRFLNACEGIS